LPNREFEEKKNSLVTGGTKSWKFFWEKSAEDEEVAERVRKRCRCGGKMLLVLVGIDGGWALRILGTNRNGKRTPKRKSLTASICVQSVEEGALIS